MSVLARGGDASSTSDNRRLEENLKLDRSQAAPLQDSSKCSGSHSSLKEAGGKRLRFSIKSYVYLLCIQCHQVDIFLADAPKINATAKRIF